MAENKKSGFDKQGYSWFLEPADISTNETLANALSDKVEMQTIADVNKHDHKLWPCSFTFIENLIRSRPANPHLKFNIFKRSHLDKTLTRHLWEGSIRGPRKSGDKLLNQNLKALKKQRAGQPVAN